MSEPELKPCPFCGSNHILFREQVGAYEIYCQDCDANVGITNTFEAAVSAWNRRPMKSCPVCGYDLSIRNDLPPIETAHLLMQVVMSQLNLCTRDQVQQLLQRFFSFVLSDHPLELDNRIMRSSRDAVSSRNGTQGHKAMNENIHTNETPLSYQVGGSHYRKYEYQPVAFFSDVQLDFNRANAIKYLVRWKDKGGVEDLKKALQYLKFAQQEFDKREEAFERFLDQFSGIERAAIQSVWLENYETAEADIEALI